MQDLPRTWKLATLWGLIGLVLFLAVQGLQRQARESRFSHQGGVITLERGPDGHFHWPGKVNGIAVDFLVDTGATRTTLPRSLADEAGLERLGGMRSDTAGGVVSGEVARADLELDGGLRLAQWQVAVLPRLSAPLLGMDVLGRMRFSQEGGRLRLEPAEDSGRGRPSATGQNPGRSPAPLIALALATTSATAQPPCTAGPPSPSPAELQAAARSATDRGVLWRLEQGGHTSYLYGSIHVGKLAWLFPGPRTQAALQSADTLALELDPTDPALAEAALDMGKEAKAGPPASSREEMQARQRREQRMKALLQRLCLHDSPLAQAPALAQAYALSSLAGRPDGLEPGYGQEIALAAQARQRRLPIVSLESIASQQAALAPENEADIPAMIDEVLDQLEDGSARQVLRRLASSWEAGRLDDLASYESWCQCASTPEERRQLARLNDERNPALAAGITRLHRDEGRRVFAAVGALHMTGPAALPGLLVRQGFVVTRVTAP